MTEAKVPVDLDLDERRKLLKPKRVRANGHVYDLPRYLPSVFMRSMFALANAREDPVGASGAMHKAYAAVFGEASAEQAMFDFSDDDFQDLVARLYAVMPGEALASVASSRNTGTRQRRTSNGSTKST